MLASHALKTVFEKKKFFSCELLVSLEEKYHNRYNKIPQIHIGRLLTVKEYLLHYNDRMKYKKLFDKIYRNVLTIIAELFIRSWSRSFINTCHFSDYWFAYPDDRKSTFPFFLRSYIFGTVCCKMKLKQCNLLELDNIQSKANQKLNFVLLKCKSAWPRYVWSFSKFLVLCAVLLSLTAIIGEISLIYWYVTFKCNII